ncbi:MAG: hypothetical protein ACP5E3_04170, partial [Bacteroidales bacterium]
MVKKICLSFFIHIFIALSTQAQDTIFFENFSSSPGIKPPGWTTAFEVGDRKWQFVNGGGTKDPGIPGSRKPQAAYSDTVNALFFYESLGGEEVLLITPPVNLEFAIKPELRFMHVQREGNLGFGAAHDELRVYYKTSFSAPWIEANKIGEYTDEVYNWTENIILLPEDVLVPECYFAFKAKTNYGWGVGIDDVGVHETEYNQRYLDNITVVNEAPQYAASGSRQNPILRLNLAVKGNTGNIAFESLEVSSLNTSDSDIPPYGVKLHANNSRDFYGAMVIDSSSFVSGKAGFNSINYDLPTGYTYIWVSLDINEDAAHLNTADLMLEAGSVVIDGQSYPSANTSPSGNSTIRESVFYDDFSQDRGWVLAGDFERGRPLGLGGNFLGNPDPEFAAADTFILGNDLSGQGFLAGDYEPNVPKYQNLATTETYDLTYYNDARIDMLRWLNVANNDTASIEMSVNGGNSWNTIWSNDNNVFTDGSWQQFGIPIPGANRKDSIQFRINLGPTTLTDHFSGWNIDNFALTANYVEYDVGPTGMLSPVTGCGLTTSEVVTIQLKNYGPAATPSVIPVRYSFDGGATWVYDDVEQSIAFEGSHTFSFSETIDLSAPGEYHVIIETLLDVDEEPTNNTWDTIFYSDPSYSLPYYEDFESGEGFWRAEGTNATLEYGTPLGSIIHTAPSGTHAWVTDLDGDYLDDEESILSGPCFDFTGIDYPVFEFKIFYFTEDQKDGAAVEYSLDNGQTWSRVGNQGDGSAWEWNWYNSASIAALPGGHGWTGEGEDWQTSRIMLDTLVFRNTPGVKFRIRFMSDSQNRIEGIAIDDIKIYDAPRDLGVVSIDYPENGCIVDTGYQVQVSIQNFGLDTLKAGETIIAGYDFEEEPTVIDTFVLESDLLKGRTMSYTFKTKFQIDTAGWKDIRAFTLLPDDVNFYNEPTSNDSTFKSFELRETPVPSLPENIFTVRPDTILLDAYIDDPLVTYQWQDGSTNPTYNVTDYDDGVYSITTSNGFCEFRDTVYVWRLIADVGIIDITSPVSDCEIGDAIKPVVEIKNFGTDTLYPGDQIPVRYQVDANAVVEETALVSEMIFPDSIFSYVFTTPADFSETRTYSISAWTELPRDDTLANDMHMVNVEVLGYTPIDLGEDVIIRGYSYTLDAGAGYDSYLWSDGSNGQSLEIDTTGTYSVTVQQGSMCPNTDSVSVILVISDITVEELLNPTNSCDLLPAEELQFYVLNSGNDTLMVNDTVYIHYSVNEGDTIEDTLIIDRRVEPGDSILFSSSDKLDMSLAGSYQFSLDIDYTNDLVPDNNHLDQIVDVYGYPELELGNDTTVNEKVYVIDPGEDFVSYLWHDGSTIQEYNAMSNDQAPDSLYSVLATDIHGCEVSDTIKIAFDIHDLGVVGLVNPFSDCELDPQEELIIKLKNEGTNTILNESVTVYVSVRGGATAFNTKTISQALQPDSEVDISIGAPINFGTVKDYNLTISIVYDPDDDSSNDTIQTMVSHYGNPEPDLGTADTLQTALPFDLDAGADYISYHWNGTPGSRTFEADAYGWYELEVTDENGCAGSDSIYVVPFTGVADHILEGNLNVYPQPASSMMNVEYRNSDGDDFILEIYDGSGRV